MIGQALDFIDSYLAVGLGDGVRVVCWAILAGAVSMGLYALASPQRKLKTLIDDSSHARQALARFDGEFAEALPLIRRTLTTALRRLGLVLLPSLLAGLPVIIVLIWLDGRFGYQAPQPGESIAVDVLPKDTSVSWLPPESASAESNGVWIVDWPQPGQNVQLMNADGAKLLSFPCAAEPTICQPSWFDALFDRPAASLPADSPVESIAIDFPRTETVRLGPGWARTPLAVFLVVTCLSSLTVKRFFRIA